MGISVIWLNQPRTRLEKTTGAVGACPGAPQTLAGRYLYVACSLGAVGSEKLHYMVVNEWSRFRSVKPTTDHLA
jgi:hypothetical protein